MALPMTPPAEFDPAHWRDCLQAHYGLSAELQRLDGEYDLNLAVVRDGLRTHVLKVMRPGCQPEFVDMLCKAHAHVRARAASLPVPDIVPARDGALFLEVNDAARTPRLVWLISHLEGAPYATCVRPGDALHDRLGETLAQLDRALQDFAHPALRRPCKWNLLTAEWIETEAAQIESPRDRALVAHIASRYRRYLQDRLAALPRQAIHNDLNDYNLMVASRDGTRSISGIIDFGDMAHAPVVANLAIAAAYALMGESDPVDALCRLAAGYDRQQRLCDESLALLFPLMLTRLAVSVTNSAIRKREHPDDPYVTISERPAWALLHTLSRTPAEWVEARIRLACGREAHPDDRRIGEWLAALPPAARAWPLPDALRAAHRIGSVTEQPALAGDPVRASATTLAAAWSTLLAELRQAHCAEALLACEGDLLWPCGDDDASHPASCRQAVRLGHTVYAPVGTPVRAPLAGTVHRITAQASLWHALVLAHAMPDGTPFYTHVGGIAEGSQAFRPGTHVEVGMQLGVIASTPELSDGLGRLHLRLDPSPGVWTAMDGDGDLPDACDPDASSAWLARNQGCMSMLGWPRDEVVAEAELRAQWLERRRACSSANLRLSYRAPLAMVRGWKQFLLDNEGRAYLDAYNNVPHVGHAHPRVIEAASRQMRLLNTNTRYVHPSYAEYAEALLTRMPDPLCVCFFVNSGTEANELALRLARTHTGQRDVIVMDAAYHGNSSTMIDLSPYKHAGPGGQGAPDWVQVVPLADSYRGPWREHTAATGRAYAACLDEAIARIHACGRGPAAFISEVFPSVGGQIIPPPDYYRHAYAAVRAAGGMCIADEVQTGLGRIGESFWAFDTQGVIPDIVVLGKPMGNGHPIGAVVTRRDIADSFANGMEFFSTFGGSTVSCVVGREVLRIVEEEGLQENARRVGDVVLDGLRTLASRHAIIGDVRGMGLFIGAELVDDRASRAPATRQTAHVVNRLREERILIGSEGPHDNVLKIRPPLCFTMQDAEFLLDRLDRILRERGSQPASC